MAQKSLIKKILLQKGITESNYKELSAHSKLKNTLNLKFFNYKGKNYGQYSAILKPNSKFKTVPEALAGLTSQQERYMKKNPNKEMAMGRHINKWLKQNFGEVTKSTSKSSSSKVTKAFPEQKAKPTKSKSTTIKLNDALAKLKERKIKGSSALEFLSDNKLTKAAGINLSSSARIDLFKKAEKQKKKEKYGKAAVGIAEHLTSTIKHAWEKSYRG